MTTNFDYTSLLPGSIEPTLSALIKDYQSNANALTSAYMYSVLPGVYTTAPNIVRAKDIQFQVAFRSLPAVRDFISYSELITSLVPGVTDRDTLVSILLPSALGWNTLEIADLSTLDKEFRALFTSYVPLLDVILGNLKTFEKELLEVDKSNPPQWFNQTLFDTLRKILSFASFHDGILGESSLAGILGISLKWTNTPLNKVLFPFFPTRPPPKDVIAEAIRVKIIDSITDYRQIINDLEPIFTPFANNVVVLKHDQAAVVPRIEANLPGPQPATAEECISAWKGVDNAATEFINMLSAFQAVSTVLAKSTTSSIVPGDVTAAFGPPVDMSSTIPKMGSTTTQITTGFNDVLSLPFVDDLKVTSVDNSETSAYVVLIDCRSKYLSLQSTSVEIVRDVNSYGIIQQVFLPITTAKDGVTLEDLLNTNRPLVMRYGQEAQRIASDTQDLLTSFEESLNSLNKNISEISKMISENESALQEAEKERDAAKARNILDGIIAAAFTAAAVAALAYGKGSLAVRLGVTAGSNFSSMVEEAVNAGKLTVVVNDLKSIIATSEATRNQIAALVPQLRSMISLMTALYNVWQAVSSNIDSVQANYEAWNQTAYFTPDRTKDAIKGWSDVQKQCDLYISAVSGAQLSPSLAKPFPSSRSNEPTPDGEDTPPPYDIASLPGHAYLLDQSLSVEELAGQARAMAKAATFNDLAYALSPPTDIRLSSNRAQLVDAANSYQQIASLLRGLYDDSANDATRLASTITSSLIPALAEAINFYIAFAKQAEDPFAWGTDEASMRNMVQERWKQLQEGSNLSKSAEQIFLRFRTDSQGALNKLTSHVNELNHQLAVKEATLRDLQADYDKWSWVIYWPIPPGVGAIIYLIIDSIKQTTNEISSIKNDINKLNSTRYYVSMVEDMSYRVGNTTSELSQSWSSLTTKTQNLETLVHAIVITPEVENTIKPIVQGKWADFSNELKKW